MIYKNINNADTQEKRRAEQEKYIAKSMKEFVKSNLYKTVESYLNSSIYKSYFEWVNVLDKKISDEIWFKVPSYGDRSTSKFKTIDDFYYHIEQKFLSKYEYHNPLPSRTDIENKVLLSMLNTKDLNELVKYITESFKK